MQRTAAVAILLGLSPLAAFAQEIRYSHVSWSDNGAVQAIRRQEEQNAWLKERRERTAPREHWGNTPLRVVRPAVTESNVGLAIRRINAHAAAEGRALTPAELERIENLQTALAEAKSAKRP